MVTASEMLKRLYKAVKTDENDIMVLPFGNAKKEDVLAWIISLSDEEFDVLLETPIISQAKIFYKRVREYYKSFD